MMKVRKVQSPADMNPSTPGAMVVSGFSNNKVLTDNDRALALPLIEVAKMAYALIMPRAFVKGQAADGGAFGQFSTKEKPDGLWIGPGRPQPRGEWYRRGRWAIYRSSADYMARLGVPTPRFVLTGQAAQSYVIKPMGPNRVKIQPKGGRPGKGSPTNARVMRFNARRLGKNPIMPNAADIKALGELAVTIMSPQLIDSAYWASVGVAARKKLRTRRNALRTLITKERTARQKINQTGSG